MPYLSGPAFLAWRSRARWRRARQPLSAARLCPFKAESGVSAPGGVEIARVEKGLERRFSRRPFAVEHREPGRCRDCAPSTIMCWRKTPSGEKPSRSARGLGRLVVRRRISRRNDGSRASRRRGRRIDIAPPSPRRCAATPENRAQSPLPTARIRRLDVQIGLEAEGAAVAIVEHGEEKRIVRRRLARHVGAKGGRIGERADEYVAPQRLALVAMRRRIEIVEMRRRERDSVVSRPERRRRVGMAKGAVSGAGSGRCGYGCDYFCLMVGRNAASRSYPIAVARNMP